MDLSLPDSMAINTTKQDLLNSTPFELFFARPARRFQDYSRSNPLREQELTQVRDELILDQKLFTNIVLPEVLKAARKKQSKQIANLDKRRRIIENTYEKGDRVMILNTVPTGKFPSKYLGPYTISRVNSRGGTFQIKDFAGTLVHECIPFNQINPIPWSGPITNNHGDIMNLARFGYSAGW